jgi:HK97 family phage major capsid protein
MQQRTTRAAEQHRMTRSATMAALGISSREARRYSLSRAMLGIADQQLSGYEKEVDAEIRRKTGAEGRSNSSVFVPTGLSLTRDLTAGTASAGGYLVGTDNLGDSFVDLLYPRTICGALGATFLPGLVGNVTIPKLAAGGTAHWLTNEFTAITETNQTLSQVAMTPKTVGGYTEFSRQLLMQSNPSVDSIIAGDLAKVIAGAVDVAAINGSGSGGQPFGILQTSGLIAPFSGASLDYAGVMQFMTTLASANALDGKTLGYMTTPTVAALLMQRQRFTSTDTAIWEGNVREGKVAGVRAMSSPNVPAAKMLLGDWSQLVIGEWGYLEITSNPFANFQAGTVGVRAMQSLDIGVRQIGAFAVAESIT